MTTMECLTLLETMGYKPELRHRQNSGDRSIELLAVVKYQSGIDIVEADPEWEKETVLLFEAFELDDTAAVRVTSSLQSAPPLASV